MFVALRELFCCFLVCDFTCLWVELIAFLTVTVDLGLAVEFLLGLCGFAVLFWVMYLLLVRRVPRVC